MNTLSVHLFIGLLIIKSYCQDIIFPDDQEQVTYSSRIKVHDTNRMSVSNPITCPKNMVQYRGKNGWVCDCLSTYLYFPSNNTCYEAFKQGPCKVGEYFVLQPGDAISKCQINPCHYDGLVSYNGTCYNFKKTGGPCGDTLLSVNETTYQLECLSTSISPFSIIDAPSNESCPPGSRRFTHNQCVQEA